MLDKLKQFLGLDDLWGDGQSTSSNNLIEVRKLQVKINQLEVVIKQQNDLLKELSYENMELGRDRRRYADTVATQKRLIDVYESMSF